VRRLKDSTGSNLVEAALITPLIVLLTFSIVDFAGLFYAYLALENGVSQATRFGITGNTMANPSGGTYSREQAIMIAMRDATPTLTIDDGAFKFEHMSPGGGAWVSGAGGPDDVDKVTITYTWKLWTPVLWPFFNGDSVVLKVDSAMKNEARFL